MRNIIIGDVHGCCGALEALLRKIQPDPEKDRLVFLGDLFDRGPESWQVFQKIRELSSIYGQRFILLTGNHEDYLMAEKLTLGQRLVWERVGRGATVKSFRAHGEKMEDCVPWLREHCRDYFSSGSGYQFAHAGVRVAPIEDNSRQILVHDHSVVLENQYAGPLTITGHIAIEIATWYRGSGGNADPLPYGEWVELPDHGVICIDTGCGKGGWLTGMIITEDNRFRLEHVSENMK